VGAGEGSGSGSSPGVKPGALTALLKEIAVAPDGAQDSAWEGLLRAGAVVGRFELVRELGHGGFGVVWEARDRELGRSVAFKAVRAGGKTAVREERLFKEAEAAARLQHPNIVTLHDVGRAEQGPYLILELLEGRTLAEWSAQGPLPLREAVRIAVEVSRGVAHAHAHGVVHRDLSPGNVFLCDDGQVKVLDFGMAHAFGQRKVEGGTRAYMAPEQSRGAPEDERTDVFALGVILHEMLSGEVPFRDAEALVSARPAPGLEVPEAPALGELVGRMLEKDPVKRPRDGGEVLSALTAFQRELERLPSTGSAPVRTRRPSSGLGDFLAELKRRRVIRALVGYAIVSFAILQIVEPVLHRLHLPDWTLGFLVLLLAAGFSVTVALSWMFDLASGRIERTPPSSPPPGTAEAAHRPTGPRLALLLAALGILSALPGLGWYFLWRERARPGSVAVPAPGVAEAKGAEASPRTVAVLPLVNLSGDPAQEYFNDGMTEEITSRLSRLAGLAVTARTSAARHKGSPRSAREIGAELAVAYLVEGSVRRAGDRIRVTASLVRTADAVRLWSEDLDARIDDVFAVQERIAGRIVEALGVKLTPAEERALRSWARATPPPTTST
jgi:serine/threonine protein kinase/TolB-like protein